MTTDREYKRIVDSIEQAEDMLVKQAEKVRYEKHIQNLLLGDYLNKIKSLYSEFSYINFHAVCKEFDKKKKSERENLECLEFMMGMKFFNPDGELGKNKNFKLTGIHFGGYDYYYAVEFDAFGGSYYIQIPNYKAINEDNLVSANYGKFSFFVRENKYVSKQLKSSYYTEDIAKFIQEYFKQEENH